MSRYDRQMILPELGGDGQAKLGAARVLVVGCGGLGSAVIPALTGAGVGAGTGELRLVDPDRVELSNLHRQTLYTMADIGLPKAQQAAARGAALNPDVRVMAHVTALDPDTVGDLMQGVDLVVDAADSFAVTYVLSDYCRKAGVPMISASVLGRQGYVAGVCGGAPSYRALFPDLPMQAASCATAGVMGPAVACLGALQAQMVLSVLLGHQPSPLGQMLRVDLAGWRISDFRFDTAPEPVEIAAPFIAVSEVGQADHLIDLRSQTEAPDPILPGALRLDPDQIATWDPDPVRRVVLCCRSGLRAWRAAQVLRRRGHRSLALLAVPS